MLTGTPLESRGRKSKREGGQAEQEKGKSDGGVKAGGVQKGEENRGERIDRRWGWRRHAA